MNKERVKAAGVAAEFIGNCQHQHIEETAIGVVLGSGWGDTLEFEEKIEIPFSTIPGFKNLPTVVEGHKRTLIVGKIAGKQVLALNGRLHLYEKPFSKSWLKMVRLQVEMLFHLGVKKIIITSAVGTLKCQPERFSRLADEFWKAGGTFPFPDPELQVGDIAIIDGFVTVFAPIMPLWGDEFCSADETISQNLIDIALKSQGDLVIAKKTGHAMLRGPQFEGNKYDKEILSKTGAGVVGMSMLPEAYIASLYGIEILGLGFVTNGYKEKHSHEENLERAKSASAHLGEYLKSIIAQM
ncbi:MAG: purine-nucleoside phosphorylase [Candidatus Falkowbacteria bacterium]|nr:MAG: purine-nucleoside phosphorylase [Candidatus Falkowbacteria bacterium]